MLSFAVAIAFIIAVWGVAQADVPKAEDIAACNKEAQEAVTTGSASPKTASPNTKDGSRATEARGDAAADRADSTTRSDDPQIQGMDAEGAKDPVYQATYRTCMRKGGF
jgi:hypothetical protein